jgi:hypothetical protein
LVGWFDFGGLVDWLVFGGLIVWLVGFWIVIGWFLVGLLVSWLVFGVLVGFWWIGFRFAFVGCLLVGFGLVGF